MLQGHLSCCLYIQWCLVRVQELKSSKKGTRLRSFHKIGISSYWTNQITVTETTTRFASSQGNIRQFYSYPGFVTLLFLALSASVPLKCSFRETFVFTVQDSYVVQHSGFVGDCLNQTSERTALFIAKSSKWIFSTPLSTRFSL